MRSERGLLDIVAAQAPPGTKVTVISARRGGAIIVGLGVGTGRRRGRGVGEGQAGARGREAHGRAVPGTSTWLDRVGRVKKVWFQKVLDGVIVRGLPLLPHLRLTPSSRACQLLRLAVGLSALLSPGQNSKTQN